MKNKNLSSHKNEEPESSILYIVGTPIGNLNDISYRALNVLRKVSLIACEDTRQTKKIMNKFEFKNKLISFNKNNSSRKIPQLIDNLESGKSIALVRMLDCQVFGSGKILSKMQNCVDLISYAFQVHAQLLLHLYQVGFHHQVYF